MENPTIFQISVMKHTISVIVDQDGMFFIFNYAKYGMVYNT